MSNTRPDMPRPGRHHLPPNDPRQQQPLPTRAAATPPAAPPPTARRRTPTRRPPPPPRRRWHEVVRVVAGVALIAAGVFGLVQLQEGRACQLEQAAGLRAVQDNIRARSAITQQQTDVDRRLVRDLVALPDDDAEGKADARRRWLIDSDRLAEQRSDRPYPEVRSCE